jgi:signal peptidase I
MIEVETQEATPITGAWNRIAEISREVHRGFVAEWTVTIVLLLFATTFLVQAFVIPSASMENTLLIGDHVLVDKLIYAMPGAVSKHLLPYHDVRRGDVIVFRYPRNVAEDYVKRAIGVPGDHIKLVNKQVWLNGHFVNEPYAIHSSPYMDPYRDNFPNGGETPTDPGAIYMLQHYVTNGELVVPANYVFAMGDNRDDSLDSRYWGLVPRENIIGTPIIIYWSYEASTSDLTNPNIGLDHIFDVIIHFPQKTRWSRTFKLIHNYPLK